MRKKLQTPSYLTSSEAKKTLKISDCHLAHLRLEGKLPFVKKGNAFMYEIDEVDSLKIKLKI